VPIGPYVPQAIRDAIADADFVCGVISNGPVNASVFLELGVAIGVGRPSLVFAAPKAELPVILRGQPYARASLKDSEALRFHLDAFLKNAGKSNGEQEPSDRDPGITRDPTRIASALDQLAAWEAEGAFPPEHELVQILADVFEAAGYVTSTARAAIGRDDLRADLAVWVDELQATIGNPLLIEVSAQRPVSPDKVRQLRHVLGELQSPLGLLVSWRLPEGVQIRDDWLGPIIIVMGAGELVELVGRGDFARTMLARRNAIVHSAA
jgi:hypothetical protein